MNVETISPLSLEEQDLLTMNALLGSVDDRMAELEQARRNNADAEIMEQITGKVTNTYTAARESFSGNLEQLYVTFDAMAARVEAMGCDHDHFLESSLEAYAKGVDDPRIHGSHKHDRSQNKETKEKRKKGDKRRVKKVKQLSCWALLGLASHD